VSVLVLPLNPKRTLAVLWIAVAALTIASLIGQVSTYFWGDGHLHTFVPQFNLDREMNIPTWFSSFLFLFAALLLQILAAEARAAGRPFAGRWRMLAVIFLILSIDEISAIHETWVGGIRDLLHTGGYLYFAWVIPGSVLVLVLAIISLRWFLSLPKRIRRLFFIAAAVFLAGAVGLEMVGGHIVQSRGSNNFTYALLANLEEVLEMSGLLIFITGLLKMIGSLAPGEAAAVSLPGRG
jgi:hypothetical protein